MRNIVPSLLIGVTMMVLMPACKKNVLSEKRSVEICYQTPNAQAQESQLTEEEKEELAEKKAEELQKELPKLRAFKAKRLINAYREKQNEIIYSKKIKVGYYECNDIEDRLILKKLDVNKLINLSCEEIINDGFSTYWVKVELTSKGKRLQVKDNRFPEDTLDVERAHNEITPDLDQDEWGVPSIDSIVDPQIEASMKQFYSGIAQGMTINQSLLSANLQTAVRLNDALKEFESDLQLPCPFCQDMTITNDLVSNMTIKRLPRLVDAYLVTINKKGFLYVITNNNGTLLIEDVVFEDTKPLKTTPTFTQLCSRWVEEDFIEAILEKEAKDRRAEEKAERLANIQRRKEAYASNNDEEEHFDMGNLIAYKIDSIKHEEPTLYEIAKQNENIQVVELLAYKHNLKEILSINVKKDKETKEISAVCLAVLAKEDVSPIGRIYYKAKEDEEDRMTYNFTYYNVAKWCLDESVHSSILSEIE